MGAKTLSACRLTIRKGCRQIPSREASHHALSESSYLRRSAASATGRLNRLGDFRGQEGISSKLHEFTNQAAQVLRSRGTAAWLKQPADQVRQFAGSIGPKAAPKGRLALPMLDQYRRRSTADEGQTSREHAIQRDPQAITCPSHGLRDAGRQRFGRQVVAGYPRNRPAARPSAGTIAARIPRSRSFTSPWWRRSERCSAADIAVGQPHNISESRMPSAVMTRDPHRPAKRTAVPLIAQLRLRWVRPSVHFKRRDRVNTSATAARRPAIFKRCRLRTPDRPCDSFADESSWRSGPRRIVPAAIVR